jgi:Ca-activated chloride channel family protein
LSITADRSLAWAEGDSVRYLLLTLEAKSPQKAQSRPAPPINLALVIDASGSMAGDKLENAKRAALGVAERLRDCDRLSIVSFASEVIVHCEAMELGDNTRALIRAKIETLESRGNTNLSGGWLTGAECVAKGIKGGDVNRVILLSDGAANAGITDLDELARYAAELAKRGVATSAVGIGDGYVTAVLQAVAEHGGGRLHDAEEGAEIVGALMGELGEIGDLAAQEVTATLHVPATAKAALVGSTPVTVGAGSLSVFAGALLAERPRSFVFRVTLPAGKVEDTLLFGATACGIDVSGSDLRSLPADIAFIFVEGARNNRQSRDEAVAMSVVRAWHAEVVRTAARMNRVGERRQARRYLERELRLFERYCVGLPAAGELLKEIAVLKQNVDLEWNERTRKEMELSAYLMESNRRDYRPEKKRWAARLNDETNQ